MTRWKKDKASTHEKPRGEELIKMAFADRERKVMQVRWDFDAGADMRGTTFLYFRALWPAEASSLPPAENPRNSDGDQALVVESQASCAGRAVCLDSH